jgi:osmotically-inducible protein OsmY
MADRYSERGAGRWEDERRFRDRDSGYGQYGDRGFLERFADEVRSWFGDEEAQRRRMRDEREDWRGERGRGDWDMRDWGRSDWGRGDWSRADWRGDWGRRSRSDWMRGPDERDWSRDWGYVEGRGQGRGSGGFGATGYGGYGAWGRERDWDRQEPMGAWRRDRDWGQHAGRGPRNYQRTDERIREDLCERFTQHSYLDPSDIDVRVQNGEVTLEGSVSDRWAKRTAEDIAEGVWGVKEVHNQIRIVQIDLGQQQQDKEAQGGTGPQRGTWAA